MASGEASTEGILTPDQSKNEIIKDEKSNEIYFQILYRRKEKEKEFKFTKYEIEPSVFFVNEIKAENGTYLYEKVFKFKRKAKKKEESKKHADPKKKEDQKSKTKDTKKEGEKKKKEDDAKKTEDKKKDPKKKEKKKDDKEDEIEIQFEIGKDSYIITFNAEDKIFYFDVELKKGNKYLTNIAKENIDQKFLNYFQKLEVYLEALKQPKEMKIYIEIPNCFNDYLSKFGILKVFSFDNIPLSKIPDLDLPKETINIFSRMLFDTKKKIENFMKEKIGIEKYSFHQVQIFIKLFISQYSKFNCKLKFIDDNDKDVTEECIQSKCGWSPLLGHQFRWRVMHTFCNGQHIYDNGSFDGGCLGQRVTFRSGK